MARKRSKLTPLQTEYKKQQKRIENFIKKAEKRGYQFESGLVPEMPKRVTKQSLESIKKLNAERLYRHSEYVSPGDIKISGSEWRKYERRQAHQQKTEKADIERLADENYLSFKEAYNLYHSNQYDYRNPDDVSRYVNDAINSRYYDDQGFDKEGLNREDGFDNQGWIYEAVQRAGQERRNEELYEREKQIETVEQTIYVPKPESISPYASPEEQVEYYKRKYEEAQRQLEEANEIGEQDLVTEAEQTNDFYKQLKEQIDRNGEEAHERYKERRNEYKQAREEIQNMTDGVLLYIERMISEWEAPPGWSDYWSGVKEHDKNTLASMLQGAIKSEGRDAVAKRMQENAEEIIHLAEKICYGSGGKESSARNDINMAFAKFSEIITGGPITFAQNVEMTARAEEGIITDET